MNSNPEVVAKIEKAVAAFHVWSKDRNVSGCRLVQYCGPEMVGSTDIVIAEAERQIRGAIAEGFRIAWQEHESKLYFCVWESWPATISIPRGKKVFAEKDLEQIDF